MWWRIMSVPTRGDASDAHVECARVHGRTNGVTPSVLLHGFFFSGSCVVVERPCEPRSRKKLTCEIFAGCRRAAVSHTRCTRSSSRCSSIWRSRNGEHRQAPLYRKPFTAKPSPSPLPPSPLPSRVGGAGQTGLSAATSQQTGLSAATAGQGCTTVDPGAILLNQEIDLFANLFPSPTSYLTVHDRLCGNSKTLLVSAFTKMAEQFCFPSAPGMDWLNAFMREVTQSDVERMADCFCTATKDIDTSNAALNEISVTIAAAVSSDPPNIASLMSSSFLDLVKTNLLTLGGDVCNGDCRETWARMIIILKGPSILNVGDEVLTDAEAYDPWDCMCSMEFGYIFDEVEAVVADLRPLVMGMVGYRRSLQYRGGSAPPPPPVGVKWSAAKRSILPLGRSRRGRRRELRCATRHSSPRRAWSSPTFYSAPAVCAPSPSPAGSSPSPSSSRRRSSPPASRSAACVRLTGRARRRR